MSGDILGKLKEEREQRGIDIMGGKKIGIPNEPKLPKFKDLELPRF
ncbi:hypothetical protein LCGC14_1833000 [marine sediment metagenome]|uniref:Uncharacterized protein n=1 Tax=marine sediment metagenome TaxID=412755 RepID=A0A0F9H3K9_9ZZZZ